MSRQETELCPICHIKSTISSKIDKYSVNCPKCGFFEISGTAYATFGKFTKLQQANISGWIREHQAYLFSSNDKDKLSDLDTPSIGEKAKKLLLFLSHEYYIAGQEFQYPNFMLSNINEFLISSNESLLNGAFKFLEYLGVSWSIDEKELKFIFKKYLVEEMNYISGHPNYMITPKGWAYIDSLKYKNADSQMAFIAMWFDKTMNNFHESIENSLLDTGYEPKRVDRHEHVNRIDDEIIALIRQSKFIVADYTGQRGGVYFESGFAHGLGLPVVWTCKEDDLENLHFDTNHYNFLIWEEDNLSEFEEKLKNRILAVIGKGTYFPE